MAIGLIPHHSAVFTIEGLTTAQFIIIVDDVAKQLNWDIAYSGQKNLVAYTKIRKNATNEKITLDVEAGLVTIKSASQGGQFIDWGRNKKNINDFILSYDGLRYSLTPEDLTAKSLEYKDRFNTDQEEYLHPDTNLEATEKSKGFFSLFIPVNGYTITPIVMDLNILIFIVMAITGISIIAPTTIELLNWGANFRPYTLDGQAWRLFTNFFLHVGILHLLFNMYALLFIGVLLEPRLGSTRFAIAYIVTGLMASITSLYLHPLTVSAGASGAIFGMYGVFLAMLTTNLIDKSIRKSLLTSIAIFVVYNLINGIKGEIDNAAHIGGLISGILIGYSMCPGLSSKENSKLNYGLPALLIIALLGFSSWEYKRIPNDIVQYDKKIKSFGSLEEKAVEILRNISTTPKEDFITAIENEGIPDWKECANLIKTLDKLDLPDEIHKKNKVLMSYCELRIKSYELVYKAVAENTNLYNDQIRNYTDSIKSILSTIK